MKLTYQDMATLFAIQSNRESHGNATRIFNLGLVAVKEDSQGEPCGYKISPLGRNCCQILKNTLAEKLREQELQDDVVVP